MKLLERVDNRVCLTKAGRDLHEFATQIVSLSDLAAQMLVEKKSVFSGEIAVGASNSVAMHLLPEVLSGWMSEHPRVNVSVTSAHGKDIHQRLLEGGLDFIFTSLIEPAPRLVRLPIFADVLVVVAPPGHPFAESDSLSVMDLSRERMILPSRGSSIGAEIKEVEHKYGLQFKVVMEVNKNDLVKQYCKAGIGIGIVSRAVANDELANGQLRLVNVEGFPRSRPYFLVYRAGSPLTREMQSLVSAIRLWVRKKRGGWQPLNDSP